MTASCACSSTPRNVSTDTWRWGLCSAATSYRRSNVSHDISTPILSKISRNCHHQHHTQDWKISHFRKYHEVKNIENMIFSIWPRRICIGYFRYFWYFQNFTSQLSISYLTMYIQIIQYLLIINSHLCLINNAKLIVFTVRRSLHGICYSNSVRPSVCPSVCHTRGLCPHGSTYDHDFFTTG